MKDGMKSGERISYQYGMKSNMKAVAKLDVKDAAKDAAEMKIHTYPHQSCILPAHFIIILNFKFLKIF
jgi:hypothetical protein